MIILESRTVSGNWLRLYRKAGTEGRKMWEWVEDKDEATKFEEDRNELEKKLNEHHCYVPTTKHQI